MEQWRDVPGYEGAYQVSDHGAVRSLTRVVNVETFHGSYQRFCPGKTRSQYRGRDGYMRVALPTSEGNRSSLVHRLVAVAFYGAGGPLEVNHKNGQRDDNRAQNLEWVTRSENNAHAYRELNRRPPQTGKFGSEHPRSRAVAAESMDLSYGLFFDSIMSAGRAGFQISKVSLCCHGLRNKHAGYRWSFA